MKAPIRPLRGPKRRGASKQGGASRDERGVILLELAMVVLFLTTLVVATLELGMAWRTSITNSNAARAGARVASYQGTGYQADLAALASVGAGIASSGRATVQRVVIFKATSGSATVPASCLTVAVPTSVSSSSGISNTCNVYSAAQVTAAQAGTLSSSLFGSGSNTNGACNSSSLDHYWCPNSRSNSQPAGVDHIGVYVEVSHATFSKLLGTSFSIEDTSVMAVEPSAAGRA